MITYILVILVLVWSVGGAFWNVKEAGVFDKLDWLVSGPLVWAGVVFIYFRDKVWP